MALSHEFLIVTDKHDSNDERVKTVSISDVLFQYMNDSLCWVYTLWNGQKEHKGFNYYGYSVIQNENIIKLKQIVHSWLRLFENAPDKFVLTGNYLLEEDEYEKKIFNREEILSQLKLLEDLCENAIRENKSILHEGI